MKRILLVAILLVCAGLGIWWFQFNGAGIQTPSTPVIPTSEIPKTSGLTPTLELANDIWSHETKWADVIAEKTQSASSDPAALKELAFAQSFVGDMWAAEASLDTYCQNHAEDGACKKIAYSFVIQKPVDNTQKPLTGLSFEILGKPASRTAIKANSATTPVTIADTTYKNTIVRSKITKKGYTDFITRSSHTAFANDTTSTKDVAVSPVFIPADTNVTKKSNVGYEVKTKNYTFTVQPDTFAYADGTPVEGDVDAYFFDITDGTPNVYATGMFSLDIFDRVTRANIGEGMITYGMPLIKAYKGDVELSVKKPIIGVGRMSNMEEFKTRNGLTQIDFTAVPKNTPIDYAAALKYNLPPFWQYKKSTGTWETSTFQILDNTGLAQFSFSDL